jgi:hypothetical protein
MELRQLSSGETLTLPDDLLWADEHAWTPAVASTTYLITGALLVQSATRQAGRPITLVGPSDMAWVTRATVGTLHAWASQPLSANDGRFELRLADGRNFEVAFRHADLCVEAEPVLGFPARSEADRYRLTLRLLQL